MSDINTLKASAREKSATRASSAASRGESPELADLVEYFNYIAGALNDGFGLKATPREWKEAVKRADSITEKFKRLQLDINQANCVIPHSNPYSPDALVYPNFHG